MPRTSKRRSRPSPRARSARAASAKKELRCPDCDFVAAHPMGLGRHRSSRHGVISQRQARRDAEGGWVTRQEAARRAGVHYNTIRQWEQSGKLRTSRRPGHRGSLVNASDVGRLSAASSSTADAARIQALEQRFNELLSGLERLVSASRSPRRGRGPKK